MNMRPPFRAAVCSWLVVLSFTVSTKAHAGPKGGIAVCNTPGYSCTHFRNESIYLAQIGIGSSPPYSTPEGYLSMVWERTFDFQVGPSSTLQTGTTFEVIGEVPGPFPSVRYDKGTYEYDYLLKNRDPGFFRPPDQEPKSTSEIIREALARGRRVDPTRSDEQLARSAVADIIGQREQPGKSTDINLRNAEYRVRNWIGGRLA